MSSDTIVILKGETTPENVKAPRYPTAKIRAEDNPALAYLLSLRSRKSRRAMWSTLNRIAALTCNGTIYTCPWGDIRAINVGNLIDTLEDEDKAPATINTYLAAIKGVAKQAWSMYQLPSDDWERIKMVRSVSGKRLPSGRFLSEEEVETLLKECLRDSSASGLRDAAIIAVLVGCGLRRTELVTLDLKHYNTAEKSLKVRGKGNKDRTAFLPKDAQHYLTRWIQEVRGPSSGALFTRIRRHGDVTMDRLTDQAVYYILDKRAESAGMKGFSPHDLRRTYASWLLEKNVDLLTVRDMMGHMNITTTQQYDRRGEDRLKEASQKLRLRISDE